MPGERACQPVPHDAEGIRMTEIHPDDVTADKGSASWKFDFLDTVNADPLANSACLAVAKAYLNFASQTRPQAYCAMPELMIRTGLTRPTLRKAKSTLERLGYLVAKFVTEEGATMYELVNARKNLIDEHLTIARELIVNASRERKVRERSTPRGGKNSLPPKSRRGENNLSPKRKNSFPNTLEEYPGVIFLEGKTLNRDDAQFQINPYLVANSGDDLTTPFDAPDTEEAADAFIESAGNFPPIIARQLRKMLMAGELTPLFLTSDLGRRTA
jgi:hypothetical protein